MLAVRGVLKAKSPFMIGSGTGISSDKDVLKDSTGGAFIPGTALAGVCRHFLSENMKEDREIIDQIFGKEGESRIIFYDAFAEEKTLQYSIRDSVRLHNKISVDKSKFDYEIVEADAAFCFRLGFDAKMNRAESECMPEEEEKLLAFLGKIASGFREGEIRIGGKTTRGFGEFELMDVRVLRLDLSKAEDMKKYIENCFSEEDWMPLKEADDFTSDYETIETELRLKHFLFIREYATIEKVDPVDRESKFVDAATLTDHKGNPVISGTTWAGAFRDHCRKILERAGYEGDGKALLDSAFGYEIPLDEEGELNPGKNDTDKKSKAKVLFSETRIPKENIVMLNRTRTAIDRFSGSAVQTGALYTERTAYAKDGEEGTMTGVLRIKIDKKAEEFDLIKSLLSVCIEDLREGILAVGGNTAIGGGIFTAKKEKEEDHE